MKNSIQTKLLAFLLVLGIAVSGAFSVNTSLSFAAADPDVTIVNPVNASTATSSNLLISVKVEQTKSLRISASEIRKITGKNPAGENITVPLVETDLKGIVEGTIEANTLSYNNISSEVFNSDKKLSFYTKKLEKITPGIYVIKVDTVAQEKVTHSSKAYVVVKNKPEAESKMFETSQTGTAAFLQGLLKSVFGGGKE